MRGWPRWVLLTVLSACAPAAAPLPAITPNTPSAPAALVSSTPAATATVATSLPVTPTPTERPAAPTTTGPPSTQSPTAATSVPTAAPTVVARPTTVSGRVSAGGPPLAGVLVRLLGAERTATATTDADGRYEIPAADGTYALQFDPPAPYVAEYHRDAVFLSDASPVRVSGSSVVVDADLLRGAALSGTIRCGGAALPGARVHAWDLAPPYRAYRGQTDASGTYRIGVPVGRSYVIGAEPPRSSGCATAWSGVGAYYAEAAEEARVTGDLRKDIELPPARRLSGTVLKADGSPAAGATVQAYGMDPISVAVSFRHWTLVSEAGADTAGRYEMTLPPAAVRLYAFDAGGTTDVWWQERASYGAATPVDVSAGSRAIDIRLVRR